MDTHKRGMTAILWWTILGVYFSLLIFPVLFQPLIYDEQFYAVYSWLVKNGWKMYERTWFLDKPPGMIFFHLLTSRFQSNLTNLYSMRVFAILYQLTTVIAFYKLADALFSKIGPALKYPLTLLFVTLITNPLFEGQYANADNFVSLPIILAFYTYVKHKRVYLAAFIMGLCFLIKQNTALEMVPISIAAVIPLVTDKGLPFPKRVWSALKLLLMQLAIFLLPTLAFSLYILHLGTWRGFLEHVFLKRIEDHLMYFNWDYAHRYFRNIFKQTSLLWIGMAGFLILPLLRRVVLRKDHTLLLLSWVVFSALSVSAGGYFFPHYFLEIIPVLVISSALFTLTLSANVLALLAGLSLYLADKYRGVFLLPHLFLALLVWYLLRSTQGRTRTLAHVSTLLLVMLLTIQVTPLEQLRQIKALRQDKLLYHDSYHRNSLKAATYLKEIRPKGLFAYEGGPKIYFLSENLPLLKYLFPPQLIRYYPDINSVNKANYIPGVDFSARQQELNQLVRNGRIEYVAVDFYRIQGEKEIAKLGFLAEILDKYYKVEKTFDRVWIYKLSDEHILHQAPQISRILNKKGGFEIQLTRTAQAPDYEVALTCGETSWHFPEDGIRFPMKAVQDKFSIVLSASNRGVGDESCNLEFKNLFADTEIRGFDLPTISN